MYARHRYSPLRYAVVELWLEQATARMWASVVIGTHALVMPISIHTSSASAGRSLHILLQCMTVAVKPALSAGSGGPAGVPSICSDFGAPFACKALWRPVLSSIFAGAYRYNVVHSHAVVQSNKQHQGDAAYRG